MDRKGSKDFFKLCVDCIVDFVAEIISIGVVIFVFCFVFWFIFISAKAMYNVANMNTNKIEQEEQKEYYCPECGNDVSEDAKFCEKCGTKLNN